MTTRPSGSSASATAPTLSRAAWRSRDRRGVAVRRRAVRRQRRRAPPRRSRRRRRPGVVARRVRVRDRHRAAAPLRWRRPRRVRGRRRPPGATACTPRRSMRCSPRCRCSPGPTRRRRGDAVRRSAASSPPRSPTPSCRSSRSTTSACSVTSSSTGDGTVVVELTPTYTGCPAMDTMRDDVVAALRRAGYDDVDVRIELTPAWSSDRISAAGRRKLAEAGIAPPAPAPAAAAIGAAHRRRPAPDCAGCAARSCGSSDTEEVSRLRGHGVQVAAPLPGRATSRSSTSRRSDPWPTRAAFHSLAVAGVDRAVRRRRGDHVRRRRRSSPSSSPSGPASRSRAPHDRRRRAAALVLDLRAGRRAAADRRARGAGRAVSPWLVRDVRPGDRIDVLPPSGTFTPDVDAAGRHVLLVAGSGITPALSIVASLLGNPAARSPCSTGTGAPTR